MAFEERAADDAQTPEHLRAALAAQDAAARANHARRTGFDSSASGGQRVGTLTNLMAFRTVEIRLLLSARPLLCLWTASAMNSHLHIAESLRRLDFDRVSKCVHPRSFRGTLRKEPALLMRLERCVVRVYHCQPKHQFRPTSLPAAQLSDPARAEPSRRCHRYISIASRNLRLSTNCLARDEG
jgi:hypothetical protein